MKGNKDEVAIYKLNIDLSRTNEQNTTLKLGPKFYITEIEGNNNIQDTVC